MFSKNEIEKFYNLYQDSLIVDQYIESNNLSPDNTIVFACGNPDMIIDIQNNLEHKKGFTVIEERFWK